jgi:6,7-dimethyl-8-ribityllumazine synthase
MDDDAQLPVLRLPVVNAAGDGILTLAVVIDGRIQRFKLSSETGVLLVEKVARALAKRQRG